MSAGGCGGGAGWRGTLPWSVVGERSGGPCYYWIARLNPADAATRGISDGDLVRLHNDRGGVICAARLSERVRPGVVHSYESSAVYEPVGAPGRSDDLGGCVNVLTPSRMMIERSHAMAANSCLIEVERWEGAPSRG